MPIKLTWKDVDFKNVFPDRKKNRIIGLCFPEQGKIVGLEPSVLTVLPKGDNVEFSLKNEDFNDDDILYYVCSVYISGYDEFKDWAGRHDKDKIVVGGYHPSTFPNDFLRYASRIVVGPCDDFFATIKQGKGILRGIVNNKKIPRYDLYDIRNNQQVIPDKYSEDICTSINTSVGCPYQCDFCCTPIMTGRRLISKPIDLLLEECNSNYFQNPRFLFIRDENFPLQKDWKDRLKIIYKNTGAHNIYLFASANLLDEEKIKFMADNNVYMICLGLEDINSSYSKNKRLSEVCNLLHEYGIFIYLSFIVNPLQVIGKKEGETFYNRLMNRLYELKPEMICGNFLMPFRGTKAWDQYYSYVSEEDYKCFDSKTAFLIRNKIVREKMHFFMFYYQWLYYTSDFYNKNVRKFAVEDTLHLRFIELYEYFFTRYNKIWNIRP